MGAAPQLAYRPLLEALAARGAMVSAAPAGLRGGTAGGGGLPGWHPPRCRDRVASACRPLHNPSTRVCPAPPTQHSRLPPHSPSSPNPTQRANRWWRFPTPPASTTCAWPTRRTPALSAASRRWGRPRFACRATASATRWARCCTRWWAPATPCPPPETCSCRTTTGPPPVRGRGWDELRGSARLGRRRPAAARQARRPPRAAQPPAPLSFPPSCRRPLPRPADSIPLLSPFIAPNLRALGPILSQLSTSPLRSGVEQWIDLLKGALAASVVPCVESVAPLFAVACC